LFKSYLHSVEKDMKRDFDTNNLALVVAAAVIIFSAQSASTARADCAAGCIGTFATVGTYDEQTVNTNAVDRVAAGTNVGTLGTGSTGLISDGATGLSLMAADFSTAFNNNQGGVVNFDTITNTIDQANFKQFDAAFGTDLAFTLSVNRINAPGDNTSGLNTNSNNTVLSGANYLGISGNAAFTIAFSRPLKEFGISAVSRGAQRAGTMTITYTDASTFVFPSQIIGATNDDTFFGHVAPAGKKISSFSWLSSPAGDFVRWDDLGFVVANFQPGDVDGDLDVDINDYNIIRDNLGSTGVAISNGDLTGDGTVNLLDFEQWKKNFPHAAPPGAGAGAVLGGGGAVPEPNSAVLMLFGVAGGLGWHVTKRRIIAGRG
jgi:hypothetical protein